MRVKKKKKMSVLQQAAGLIHRVISAAATAAATTPPAMTALLPLPSDDTLAKRWSTLRRLSVKNLELETQVKSLQRELNELRTKIGDDGDDNNNTTTGGAGNAGGGLRRRAKPLLALIPEPTPLCTLSGHRDTLTAVVLHPSESLLYSVSEDGTLRCWDLDTAASSSSSSLLQTVRPHTDAIHALSLSSNQQQNRANTAAGMLWLATGSADCNIRLIDVSSQNMIVGATLRGHEDSVTCLRWLPRSITGGASIAASTPSQTTTTSNSSLTAWWLWSGSRDGELRQWDPQKGVTVCTVRNPGGWVRALDIGTTPSVSSSSSSANVLTVAATIGGDQALSLWDGFGRNAQQPSVASTVSHLHDNVVQAIALSLFSSDLTLLNVFGSDEEKLHVKQWQAEEQYLQKQTKRPLTVVVNGVEISAMTSATAEDQVNSGSTGTVVPWTPHFVATGGRDKKIVISHCSSGRVVLQYRVHENWVRALSFTPSGKHLLSAGDDGNLMVLDLAGSDRVVRKIAAHAHFVTCMHLLENGKMLVTGGADGLLKLWTCL
jgi:WD40 repeat protein